MSPSPMPGGPDPTAPRADTISLVRYSLPELLEELQLERTAGSFAMEKLNQAEIAKLFQPKKKRRVKSA